MKSTLSVNDNFVLVSIISILIFSIPKTESLDACIFTGSCNIGKLLGEVVKIANGNQNARNDPEGEAPVVVSGNWIESASLETDQIYLFAQDAPSMTWYDAERYCEDKGAFLAEPFDEAEQNFLRDQANRLPKTNWWLGLREFEKCNCHALGRKSSSKIEAFIDQNSLLKPENNGLGSTTCPSDFEKRCDGKEWRWRSNGQRLTYEYWNTKTGEPNGGTEHCMVMWFKSDNQRWGDWHCKTTIDSPNENSGFKPVCQKTKNTNGNVKDPSGDDYDCDYDDYGCDETEDQNASLEDVEIKCVAVDVAYKFDKKGNNIITKINEVESFQQCQLKCAEEPECKYWKFKQNGKCILSRNLKKRKFAKNKPGVVSGTMLNGCRPNTNPETTTDTNIDEEQNNLKKDYCVEYGATYNGGNQLRVHKNIDNAEICRQRCLETDGCSYYTFTGKINKRGRKKKICVLKSASTKEDLDIAKKKYSFAGSVVGACRGIELFDNDACHCVKLSRKNSANSDARGQTSIFTKRINPNDQVEEFLFEKEDSVDQQTFFDSTWTQADIVGNGNQLNDNTKCKKGDVKRCKSSINTNDQLNQQYTRGEYCVDYNVRYEEGDEFKVVDNVSTAQECRFECLTTQRSDGCRFYSWSKLNKKCYLMNEELWFPTIEKNAVSGTLDGLCKTQSFGQLGECECQKIEIYDEYYDEADLVSTGLIDVRSGVSSGCPEDHGKRCFSRVPVTSFNPSTDSRSFLRGILPDNENSDGVVFG